MAVRYAITTIDNPYDPIDDFTRWFKYDIEKGYNTCNWLANVSTANDLMSEVEYNKEVERAIDEIIRIDPMKKYKKIVREYSQPRNVSA